MTFVLIAESKEEGKEMFRVIHDIFINNAGLRVKDAGGHCAVQSEACKLILKVSLVNI